MDAGFRRPGRFDRVLFVAPPDLAGRAAILRLQLRGKPVDNIDVEAIARKTPQCSGADLQAVVDRAVESKLGEAIRAGKALPLTTADLLAAAKVQTATTREWFASAKNYATFANQGGLYDDVLHYLKQHP
jgi:transitional endoplasmic reticulum ATPase